MSAPLMKTITIASGESISSATTLHHTTDSTGSMIPDGSYLFAVRMPSAWTTANLTFQASFDNGTTWNDMYDANGLEIVVSASTSRAIMLDPTLFSSVPMIKVRSGTAGTPVNQGASRSIGLILRSI